VVAGLPPGPLGAQSPLGLTPTCSECGLSLDTLAVLSGRDQASGPLDVAFSVVEDAAGRFWVSFGSGSPLTVYSPAGAVEAQIPVGQGPGEAMAPQAVVPVADSVAVFDLAQGRVTIFGPDLTAIRTFRVDGQFFSGLMLEWPRVVVNGLVQSPTGFGQPLHLLDLSTGELLKSFGSPAGGSFTSRDMNRLFLQILEGSDPSYFLTVPRTRLSVQRWSAAGESLEVIEAAPDWFPANGEGRMGSPESPPEPIILSATRRGDVVLMSIHLPKASWAQAWTGLESLPHAPGQRLPARESLYDYFILGVDLGESRVINRWSVEYAFRPNSRAGEAFVAAGPPGALVPDLYVLGALIRPTS
jgi:hypothetical protein